MALRLGKLAPKSNPKTLDFARYLSSPDIALPEPVAKVYREYKTPDLAKQMYGNDQYGDCVWAMLANFVILTTVHTGTIVIPTVEEVLKGYSDVTGFDPTTGANDNGTAITDALAYMQSTGLAGHKILAWAQIDHSNLQHRQLGAQLFGATLVGVQLPSSAMDQFNAGSNWEVDPESQIEGGHAILRPGYGSEGDDYVTWAKWDQKASSDWSAQYVDEEYVAITNDWFNLMTQHTPGGLDLATLEQDLKALTA